MTKSLYLQKLLLLARGVSTAEFAFMVVIADHLNEKVGHPRYGRSWPGYSTIQREAKIRSRATVAKLVKSLKQKGLIVVHGDGQEVNCYEPQFDAIRKLCPADDLTELESRKDVSELVHGVNRGGSLVKPQVVHGVNQGGLTSEPERPRERPTLTRSKNVPPREQGDLRSEQGGQGRLSDFIKNHEVSEVLATAETLLGNSLARSTRPVESVAASVVSLFKEICREEGRYPSPEEVADAIGDPVFAGLRGLSFGLLSAPAKRGEFKNQLVRRLRNRKLETSLLAQNSADRHAGAIGEAKRELQSRPAAVLERRLPLWLGRLYAEKPDDPDIQAWVAEELAKPPSPCPVATAATVPPAADRTERPIGYDLASTFDAELAALNFGD